MILKVQTVGGWAIFGEIDHIEYNLVAKGEDEEGGELDYTSGFSFADNEAKPLVWRIWFFTKNMTESTSLKAYSPVYLMNDNGRTVETL